MWEKRHKRRRILLRSKYEDTVEDTAKIQITVYSEGFVKDTVEDTVDDTAKIQYSEGCVKDTVLDTVEDTKIRSKIRIFRRYGRRYGKLIEGVRTH